MYTGIQLNKLVKETPNYVNIKVGDTSMTAIKTKENGTKNRISNGMKLLYIKNKSSIMRCITYIRSMQTTGSHYGNQ
jgi:hypothetical protein